MFSWPAVAGKPASIKTFDVGAILKVLTAAGVKDAKKLCVPFQLMYALLSNNWDDDKRLAYAHRFCSCAFSNHHEPVTASAHEQAAGLDRALLLRHES